VLNIHFVALTYHMGVAVVPETVHHSSREKRESTRRIRDAWCSSTIFHKMHLSQYWLKFKVFPFPLFLLRFFFSFIKKGELIHWRDDYKTNDRHWTSNFLRNLFLRTFAFAFLGCTFASCNAQTSDLLLKVEMLVSVRTRKKKEK